MVLSNHLHAPRLGYTMSCHACGVRNATSQCGRCRRALYCSQECQLADWQAGHNALCGIDISNRENQHRMDVIRRNPSTEYLTELVGPRRLSYFKSEVTGARYFFFGETHTPTPKEAFGSCPHYRERLDLEVYPGGELLFSGTSPQAMDIVRFFYAATQAAEHRAGSRMLDIYFEHQFRAREAGLVTAFPGGNLSRLEYLFEDCLFDEKRSCGLKHSRIHYVDYRGQIDVYRPFGKLEVGFSAHDRIRYDYSSYVVDTLGKFMTNLKQPKAVLLRVWQLIEFVLRDDGWLNRYLKAILYAKTPWDGAKQLFPEEWMIEFENLLLENQEFFTNNARPMFFQLNQLLNMMRYMVRSPEHVTFMVKFRKQLDKLRRENDTLWSILVAYYDISESQLENKPPFELFETVRTMIETGADEDRIDIVIQQILEPLKNFMDIPALARILRTFGDPNPPGIKMAYVGDAHRKAWVKFFTQSGLVDPNSVTTIKAQPDKCLHLSGHPQVQRLLRSAIRKN